MYKVSEEHQMLRDLVKKFVRNELMPLEKNILDRFASGQPAALSDEENQKLFKQCKELGLWALDVPEEVGGANLPAVALVGVNEELGRTVRALHLPAGSPEPAHADGRRRIPSSARNTSSPTPRGETISAIAISEPGAGGDPAGMNDARGAGRRRLGDQRPQDLDQPRRQGRLHHRHGGDRPEKGARGGITAFLVDKGTPGFIVRARHPDARRPAHLRGGVRGLPRARERRCSAAIGQGFAPMQLRLTIRRLQMGSWCIGMAQRALDMMVRARQPARDLRPAARRPAGDPVVGRRRRDQDPCLPPDGDGRRGQAGRGPRRAHGGLDDQGLRHRDGDRGDRPRPCRRSAPWA